TSTHIYPRVGLIAEISNNTILGLRAQITENVDFLYPPRSFFIVTLLSSTGDQWSAKAVDGDNVIAAGDVCATVELALQALLKATSHAVWERMTPIYIPY
ncbi:unnamed protein product, partial [Aureobasidium uvarum]